MKHLTTILLLLATTFSISAFGGLVLRPDLGKTPGFYCTKESGDFKAYRYKEQIATCNRNVSPELKQKIYESYGIPKEERQLYTIDHMVPLSMGGSNDQINLWPQLKDITSAQLELRIFLLLDAGRLSVREAQDIVLSIKK